MRSIEFEAFAVGVWNGMSFTRPDLETIAQNFSALEPFHKVPLKFGHNDKQPLTDGQPALGWVTKAWVDNNDKLMLAADNVPDIVARAIEKKLYRKVSIELDLGVEYKGKKYAYVLSGVALLGADLPAVNTLADLTHYIDGTQRLAASRRSVFSAIEGSVKQKETEMTPEEITKLVQDGIANGLKSGLSAMQVEFKKAEDARNAEQSALRAKANREAATKILEDAVKEKRITPAQRESFSKTVGLDDDTRIAALNIEDLKSLIPGKDSNKMFSDQGRNRQGDESSNQNNGRVEQSADKEIDRLVKLEMDSQKVSYSAAYRRVLEKNQDLGAEWLNG